MIMKNSMICFEPFSSFRRQEPKKKQRTWYSNHTQDNSVTFRILAPKASKVEIEGDFLPAQKIKTPFGEVEAPGRVRVFSYTYLLIFKFQR